MSKKLNLEFNVLRAQYLSGELTPETLVNQLDAAIKQEDANPIWIRRLSLEEMLVHCLLHLHSHIKIYWLNYRHTCAE